MGQSTSTHNHHHSSTSSSSSSSSSAAASLSLLRPESSPRPFPFDDSPPVPRTNPGPSPRVSSPCPDYISDIPDECLALVFQFLGTGDRKRCSQVSRRWLLVEGQSRHRLSLNAQSDLLPNIPSIFARFDSVTKLALRCDRRSTSIGDEALVLISVKCRNLVRLKLRACRGITDAGIADFAKNCWGLRKLSCGSCTFGAKGMNALLDNCSSLEELSVKRLRGLTDGASAEPIGPGCAASALKTICLKELYNGQCFGPLIIGSRNLKTLRLFRCSGDWDGLLQLISERVIGAVEVHLEKIQVGDAGLSSLSKFSNLEILHLVKTVECTNFGLVAVAERCKLLRKLHIDGCKANRIGDDGLSAVAKHCLNLQELVLIGVNPTKLSLDLLATNCQNLERLALCGSDTVGDAEISCIAGKCIALRKLCIRSCPVSNEGMKALASGCPSLVKVKVKKCRNVTRDIADWLKVNRRSLLVNLDSGDQGHVDDSASDGGVPEIGFEFPPMLLSVNLGRGEQEHADASASDGGVPDIGFEFPPMFVQTAAASTSGSALSSSGLGRSSAFKSRLGILSGKNLVACTFRKWSRGGSVS